MTPVKTCNIYIEPVGEFTWQTLEIWGAWSYRIQGR